VYVTDRDIRLVAKHLGTSPDRIESSYTCRDEKGMKSWTLPYGICTWLSGRSCLIYPVRPEQCRTFPFWPDEEWEEICKDGGEKMVWLHFVDVDGLAGKRHLVSLQVSENATVDLRHHGHEVVKVSENLNLGGAVVDVKVRIVGWQGST
jgi:Fe-S-cluster containining protein